jgi:hypothetical protein
MAVIWTAPRPGEEGSAGHVRPTLTVTNRADQVLAECGLMRPEEVRTVRLDNVLVDTGPLCWACRPTSSRGSA